MGKKKGGLSTKRKAEQLEDEGEDPELEAELQALRAIQAEKAGFIPEYKDGDGVESESDGDELEGRDDTEEEDEKEDERGPSMTKPKRQRGLYNKEALVSALESMPTNDLPFVEKMEICDFGITVEDENDDLQRETEFFNQSLLAVTSARRQLKDAGVPYRRPQDYFAESVKSDQHMGKVKERLIHEQKKIEAFEMRRQRETNRKYNKQLQLQKKMEREQSSKDEISAITHLRKSGKGLGGKDDEEGKAKLEKILGGRGVGDRNRSEKSLKRKNMDKKYGRGIKEKMKAKIGDKKSFNDFSGYSPRGGKQVKRPGGGVKKSKGASRPGKSKRDAKKASK